MSLQAQRYNPRHRVSRRQRRRRSEPVVVFQSREVKASRRQPPSEDVVALACALDRLKIKNRYEPLRWSVRLRNGQVAGFQADLVLPQLGIVIECTSRRRTAVKQSKVDLLNRQNCEYHAILVKSETAFELAADHEKLLDLLYDHLPPERWYELEAAERLAPMAA